MHLISFLLSSLACTLHSFIFADQNIHTWVSTTTELRIIAIYLYLYLSLLQSQCLICWQKTYLTEIKSAAYSSGPCPLSSTRMAAVDQQDQELLATHGYLDSTGSWPLKWRHNGRDGISNHQPHDCPLNRLFKRRSKKTPKLRVTGLCEGNSPVNSPHKGPVTWKISPLDDVIMLSNLFMVTEEDAFTLTINYNVLYVCASV